MLRLLYISIRMCVLQTLIADQNILFHVFLMKNIKRNKRRKMRPIEAQMLVEGFIPGKSMFSDAKKA